MSDMHDQFTGAIAKDLLSLCVGGKIGTGAYREVYEWLPDTSLVLKVEMGAKRFSNHAEWALWNDIQHWTADERGWFAPCTDVSDCGIYLLQKRTTPLRESELPKKVLRCLTDLKPDNFGWLDGRIVCHDYAMNLAHSYGITRHMRKADWNL